MTPERQAEILTFGAEEILPMGALVERLRLSARERRPLRVKQGFDPTAPDIHLGHTVGLRKLRQFQDLGHQVVLIVGDYTGMVGDPSGQSKTRPQLTPEAIEANARTYLAQFYRVLDPEPALPRLPVEVRRNGEWFSGMSFMEVMRLAAQVTVARLLERDDFALRFKSQQPISVHELFYPLMQGYDSVAVRADIELGGTEQKFNLLVGRTLQELQGQAPQLIMTLPILPGLDGVQRMSKSLGNYVGVTDTPAEMFGKIMSVPDTVIGLYWRLVTDASLEELAAVEQNLADPAVNPMTVKQRLGQRVVAMYHGEQAARQAKADFEAQFRRRETPEHLEEFDRTFLREYLAQRGRDRDKPTIVDFLVASGICDTRGAARRLIEQRAVRVDQELVEAVDLSLDSEATHVIRAGRKMKRYKP